MLTCPSSGKLDMCGLLGSFECSKHLFTGIADSYCHKDTEGQSHTCAYARVCGEFCSCGLKCIAVGLSQAKMVSVAAEEETLWMAWHCVEAECGKLDLGRAFIDCTN